MPVVAAACGVAVPGADLPGRQPRPRRPAARAAGRSRRRPTSRSPWPCWRSWARTCRRALRAFLLTLAVVDDLIVIVIIAVFYTSTLHLAAARWSPARRSWRGRCCSGCGSRTPFVYVPLAVLAWWCVHESGIHATDRRRRAGPADAGPARPRRGAAARPSGSSTCCSRSRRASRCRSSRSCPPAWSWPAGATCCATRSSSASCVGPGASASRSACFGGTWLVTRFTRAELNDDLGWRDVVGVAVLAGIGFTVSLLVADLSFAGAERDAAKTAVLAGSVIVGGPRRPRCSATATASTPPPERESAQMGHPSSPSRRNGAGSRGRICADGRLGADLRRLGSLGLARWRCPARSGPSPRSRPAW